MGASAVRMSGVWPAFVVLGLGLLVAGVCLLLEGVRRKCCLGQEMGNSAQTGNTRKVPRQIEGNTVKQVNGNEEQESTGAGNTLEEENTIED